MSSDARSTALFLLLSVAVAAPLGAQSVEHDARSFEKPCQISIPAGTLVQALDMLGEQAQMQILYAPALADGVNVQAVSGTLTFRLALERLLDNTGLRIASVNDKTVVLLGSDATGGNLAPADQMRMARVGDAGGMAANGANGSSGPDGDRASGGEEKNPAQGSPERSSDKVQEIIVTAQKRAQRLQDVPISMAVLREEDLDKRRITGIDDLQRTVPGLASWSNGGYLRRIQLRGIGNGSGSSSLIGLYLDEASVTSDASGQLDLRTYDLERIEVLRGPQGTLYGDGSVGGTIRFITKDPMLDEFGGYAGAMASATQDGAPSRRFEGALNVPIVENRLGLRIAGLYDHMGGWIDQPAAGNDDFNGQDVKDARVKGLWKPVEELTVSALALIHRNDGSNNNREDGDGNYTQVFNLTTTPRIEDDYELYNLTLAYDFPAFRLLSTTGYIGQETDAGNYGTRLGSTPPGTPQSILYEPSFNTRRFIGTQELRMMSSGSGPWQWTLGGFWRRYRFDDQFPAIFVAREGQPLPASFAAHRSGLSKSWAAFGDSSYKLTERLTLGAGLRYFQDDQEFTDFIAGTVQSGRFHASSPRLYAQYKLSRNVNTYASVAKGFRSGGFNRLNQPPFGPETVWTYELGGKMSWVDNRLSADMAVFHSDYTDYQISGTLPPPALPLFIIRNAGSARIKGVEWALSWRPARAWEFGVSGDYLHTEFYEINVVSAAYQVGDPIDLIPKYQFTASVQRDFGWHGKAGFARLDYSQQGRETFRNRGIGPWYYSESDVINSLAFDVVLALNERLSLGLFAQNLLNDRGYTDAAVVNDVASRARPRTIGISFDVSFD